MAFLVTNIAAICRLWLLIFITYKIIDIEFVLETRYLEVAEACVNYDFFLFMQFP